jgi:hypothetical protein
MPPTIDSRSGEWTDDDNRRLREYWATELPTSQVAQRLNRTVKAVSLRVYKLSLPNRNRSALWTEEKARKVKRLWLAGCRPGTIAEGMGETTQAVQYLARKLKLPLVRSDEHRRTRFLREARKALQQQDVAYRKLKVSSHAEDGIRNASAEIRCPYCLEWRHAGSITACLRKRQHRSGACMLCGQLARFNPELEPYLKALIQRYRGRKTIVYFIARYRAAKANSASGGHGPIHFSLLEFLRHAWVIGHRRRMKKFWNWSGSYTDGTKPSIQRIDPTKPYTLSNIDIIPATHNNLMSDFSPAFLISIGKYQKMMVRQGKVCLHSGRTEYSRLTGSRANLNG